MNIPNPFKKQQTKSFKKSNKVPSGLIAHTSQGYFYIKGEKKFKFVSDNAMLSWNLPIIETTVETLSKYASAGILGYRDGSLVKDISDGKIYLISDSKRRHVVNPDVLEWIDSAIIDAGQKEILVHQEGEPIGE